MQRALIPARFCQLILALGSLPSQALGIESSDGKRTGSIFMFYSFAQLLPERVAGAAIHNALLLDEMSYGIEVTEPELAVRCQLGNLDPQHTPEGSGEAAIAAAITSPLPPKGAKLVTIRPDMDALGAMAILALRANAEGLSAAVSERAGLVAQADSFSFGFWPGPKPLPVIESEWQAFASEPLGLAPVSMLAMDTETALAMRVKAIEKWLKTGELPSKYTDAVKDHAAHLAAAYASGQIAITARMEGKLALVVGEARDAHRLGYYLAPAVLAVATSPSLADADHRKVTVAQYSRGILDLRALADTLSVMEPGWGGSATIIGSPQGVGSAIPIEQLIAEIEAVWADH